MPEGQQIIQVSIEEELKRSYLDYAMSVIIGRALPDARDGLKPVHRRILYAMRELGLEWNKPFKKSARVVGDVIGKYHPHGEGAVYDAIVRMAQDFTTRYPLIDGQGNFGSIDGDPPAAMRYTEIRMSRITAEMMEEIDKDTVDFQPNYDESLQEPTILPTKIPNLLINGASGIAVGMATNIPPHNLREINDAAIALLENPNITISELIEYVKGPDFPTGGFILGKEGVKESYETGRGTFQIRGRATVEIKKGERENIVITEIPYQVNKAKLIERIAELVRDKKIEGISEIRDESDREGIRIVLELKREANAKVILNQLFLHTPLQISYGVILLAILNGEPKILNLKEALLAFIEHRKEVVTRRTSYDLKKAEERAHILEGLKRGIEHIDEIVAIIRRARNPEVARDQLISRFEFTEAQAQAILDLKLQRLTSLEREKILEEYRETLSTISRLREILSSEAMINRVIKDELIEIREKYGDERRTRIIEEKEALSIEDLIAEEDMVVTVTHSGYLKRSPLSIYRKQRRGGKGTTGILTKDEDFVENLFVASTHDYLLFFTNAGRVYWLKVHLVPQAGRLTKGKPIVQLVQIQPEEKVTAVCTVREFKKGEFVFMATQKGFVKKTDLRSFSNPRSSGIIAIGLDEGDTLIGAKITRGGAEVILATENGKAIRFSENNVRETGRVAKGVRGIALGRKDKVVGMEIITDPTLYLLAVTERGFAKRSRLSEYRRQRRGGSGIKLMNLTEKTGKIVGIVQASEEEELMIITDRGKILRIRVADIRITSRSTSGVRVINMEERERVAGIARVMEKEDDISPETD